MPVLCITSAVVCLPCGAACHSNSFGKEWGLVLETFVDSVAIPALQS